MTGRWIAIAAMAAGVGSAGCSKPARLPPPPAVAPAPSCPLVVPAPVPAKGSPASDALAALEPSDAERMAVVVLMVPGGGDPGVPKRRHEYKLSLAADADSAAVEVDGQPMGAARVQHLLPATLARLGTRASEPVRAAGPRPRPIPPEGGTPRPPRMRILPATMQPASFVPPPNGAPIID